MEYTAKGRAALIQQAAACQAQYKFAEALEIYSKLLNYQNETYGKYYYGNAELYNDIGTLYSMQGICQRAYLIIKRH